MPKKYTQEEFLAKAHQIHGDKIDFTKFQYISSITPSQCKCNICGNEWMTRPDVILRGCGCQKCAGKRLSNCKTIAVEEIQQKIDKIGLNVTIFRDSYINTKYKCKAQCNKCGYIWEIKGNDLLNGHGCPQCAQENLKHKQEDALSVLKEKYNGRFDFTNTIYKGCHEHITTICCNCGKEKKGSYNRFLTQDVNCSCSENFKRSKLEKSLIELFEKNNIVYLFNHSFEWLKQGCGKLSLDFYLPQRNIAIECQGIQHFEPRDFGNHNRVLTETKFHEQQHRDLRKKQLCKENNIKLIYYLEKKYEKFMKEDDIYFTDVNGLIKYINTN